MSSEHKAKSLRPSVISMIIALKKALDGDDSVDESYDTRNLVDGKLDELLGEIQPDPTGWASLKTKLFYDVYLLQRQEEGTMTPFDLVRTGLTIGQFSDNVAFHQHCVRVGEERKNTGEALTKRCPYCGEEKSIDKFRRRGGAKCNACQAKEYRERRNAT